MSPSYKVNYFHLTALGEPIRFLLSYGGIEFDDNRVSKETWTVLKPSLPYGQLPTLEHNGKIASQSVAICRYLAKQVKLDGKDDWENLEIDATVDTIHNLRLEMVRYHYQADEQKKQAMGDILFKETLPFYLGRLDAQAKKNNGYFVDGRLTWADIFFVALLDYLEFIAKKDLVDDKPNLRTIREKVLAIPSIKLWMEKRPMNHDLFSFFANYVNNF